MIGAIVLGLLAGYIAKALLPGKDPGGPVVTFVIGVGGAVVGFLVFTSLLGVGDTDALDLGGLPGAVIGSLALLYGYRQLRRSSRAADERAPRVR